MDTATRAHKHSLAERWFEKSESTSQAAGHNIFFAHADQWERSSRENVKKNLNSTAA